MTLSVRIPEELESRLTAVSKKAKITNSQLIREALITHLEDLEDYYDGIKALREFQKSGAKAIPADEVFKKLGL
jgi:RHH-type rel operon transcriptional repressor/antitoxin RelB